MTKIRTGRTGISSVMATIIIVVISLAIIITASLWSGGLSSIFTHYENVEVKNAHITSRDGEHTVIVQYENVGSSETSVDDVLINDVPYSEYTPTPKLGGDIGSLPSTCEIGVSKEGIINFKDGATDRSGNILTRGVTLKVTFSTQHGQQFQATMIIPDGGSQSSIIQESTDSNSSLNSSSGTQITTLVNSSNGIRFRLGATVPSSSLRQFGSRHGISIELSYEGGKRFYDYMTKGPGFFAHIDLAMGIPDIFNWGYMKQFLKGMLDSADVDGGRCEISISLYGVDLGWYGLWEGPLLEVLDAIGPNRPSMRFIFLKGETTYKNRMPPAFEVLKADFYRAKQMVANYGYEFGWQGEGKYLTNIPKELWSEVYNWGPRLRPATLSRIDPAVDSEKALRDSYNSGNWWERPNDVQMGCFTMWDQDAFKVNVPPYYITYEKFDSFLQGASDRYDVTNGMYPQSVTFNVLPNAFNDIIGQPDCPYLQWWTELAQKYALRTSLSDPVPVRQPSDLTPPYTFPPYPTAVQYTNNPSELPPFYVQAGGTFDCTVNARILHTMSALSGKKVEIYLVRQDLKAGSFNYYDHPITPDEFNNKIYVGSITTGSDGWGKCTFIAPSELGRYTCIARIQSTSTEMEAFSPFMEYILVTDKVHRVEIRTNVIMRVNFGPSAYGPPWNNCDPERWVEPTKSVWGWCAETDYTFIAPSQVQDNEGKTWTFSHWEDGNTNPMRIINIDKDYIIEASYVDT